MKSLEEIRSNLVELKRAYPEELSAFKTDVLEEEASAIQQRVLEAFGKNAVTLDSLRKENKELRDKIAALETKFSNAAASIEDVDAVKQKIRTELMRIYHDLGDAKDAHNGRKITLRN